MATTLNKQDISIKCRILGVHVNASLAEIKQSRDRLAKLYHPDKHINASTEVKNQIQERFKIIQSSYEYLKDNYQEIQNLYKNLDDFALTSKESNMSKAHWVYKTVESYN